MSTLTYETNRKQAYTDSNRRFRRAADLSIAVPLCVEPGEYRHRHAQRALPEQSRVRCALLLLLLLRGGKRETTSINAPMSPCVCSGFYETFVKPDGTSWGVHGGVFRNPAVRMRCDSDSTPFRL